MTTEEGSFNRPVAVPRVEAIACKRLVFPAPFMPMRTIISRAHPVSGSVKSNTGEDRDFLKYFSCRD